MAQVVEALRGDALRVAMDISIPELLKATGKDELLAEMKKFVFPLVEQESKELYREGHKTRESVLTRQGGEAMQNYVLRRRRWWSVGIGTGIGTRSA